MNSNEWPSNLIIGVNVIMITVIIYFIIYLDESQVYNLITLLFEI